MLRRMIQTGLLAGFLTALVYSVVQALTVTPLILQAETYEQTAGAAHLHDDGSQNLPTAGAGQGEAVAPAPWQPGDGAERYGVTFLANLAAAVGFAFVLAAAFALSRKPVDRRAGLWWGLAGVAIFTLSPSLGLPPEVPGAAAADLEARQLWWVGAVAATAVGLGLVVFAQARWLRLAGVAIVLVPHLVGAPHPAGVEPGPVPPELASLYVVWSLVTSLLFWLLLGGSAGEIYRRLGGREARVAEADAAT